MPHSPLRRLSGTAALVVGTIALTLGALLSVVRFAVYERESFAERTAAALHDPGVRDFVSDRVTDAIISQRPDLIALRPFILAAANGLIGTRPFEGVVRTAANRVHELIFSEGAERVVVALPDVGLLVRDLLQRASPELAAKIPSNIQQSLATLSTGGPSQLALKLLRRNLRLRVNVWILLLGGLTLLGLMIWLSNDRRRAASRAGIGLAAAGGVLVAVVPVVRMVLNLVVKDDLLAGAASGLAASYLGDTRVWGIAYLGVGLIAAAGGAAFLDRFAPLAMAQRAAAWLTTPPERVLPRLGWALLALALGLTIALNPMVVAAGLVMVGGVLFAYSGLRELFRLLALWAGSVPAVEAAATRRGWSFPVLVTAAVAIVAIVVWLLIRNPFAPPVRRSVVAVCNGEAALCDRRVEEVVFPGAHNAMSNQDIPDWMFPHHQAGLVPMLQDGIRAFAIDMHYGFPGGARIKTDFDGKSAAKLTEAVGPEAAAIAERIRNTLVGADEGRRGVYFCHGFCELGAYEVTPVLREMRDFLVANPDEVIILIIEDYVSTADIVKAFDDAQMTDLVYKGPVDAPWPTLRTLITMNQRVIVFIESNTPGVPWLRPVDGQIQETPYTFHGVAELSCKPNRGGTNGSLFLLNTWIETTPTPKPSNAEIVNAHDALLARARKCERERRHLPNILLVDFYRSGDVVGVAREMNGEEPEGR
jgi:hypothetical protein